MPLSEYEQRVLEQLEHDLGSDPKMGHAMGRTQKSRGHLTGAVVGVLVGLAVVLAGVITQVPLIGVAGFAIMLTAAIWGLVGGKTPAAAATNGRSKAQAPHSKPKVGKNFMGRLEDRFERRREEGDI